MGNLYVGLHEFEEMSFTARGRSFFDIAARQAAGALGFLIFSPAIRCAVVAVREALIGWSLFRQIVGIAGISGPL
jgi:hypothetical protein